MTNLNLKRLLTAFLVLSLFSIAGCFDQAETLSSEPSQLELDDVVPTCPGISTITLTSGPSLTVTWAEASDNLTQASSITYKIYMRTSSTSYDLVSPAKIVVGATSTLISSGISVGNTYTLFATCSDEKGNTYPTGPLNEKSISVSDTLPPSQITNLAAGSATFTTLLLTWSPSDDGAGGTTAGNMTYKVYASTSSSVSTSGSALATVTAGGTSYLHTGLSPATAWYYKVVAVDASGNQSAGSNEATGTTSTDSTAPTFTSNTSSTSITSAGTTSVSLSWTAASDNVTSAANMAYRIYRCSGSTTCSPYSGTLVTTVTGGTTTYADTGLSTSTVYVYGIRAVDSSSNVSTNTDTKVTSTTYSNSGSFYAYPSVNEVNIRMGISAAVANVVGTATGSTAYPDLIVGAPNASEAGTAYRFTGCVFVFAGTGTGTFSSTATGAFCQPNPGTSGTQNGLNFGSAVATGDLDADTVPDIVVSAPLRGTVYIYRTQNNSGTLSIGTTAVPVAHASANATFGTGLCIGNSDNVGADDLFIATTSENCTDSCGVTGTGTLMVFNNTSTAGTFIAPSTVSYRINNAANLTSAGYTITANEVTIRSCTFGKFDASNSTQTQLVIGSGTVSIGSTSSNDGVVAFYRKGSANTFTFQNAYPTAAPSVTGNQWGNSVAAIQLDSGAHELLVGAPNDSNVGTSAGAAFLYTVTSSGGNFTMTDTGQTFYGGTDFDNNAAGSAVVAANIWGHTDSREDFVMGAYLDDGTMTLGASAINLGQVFTYRNVSGTVGPSAQQYSFDFTNRQAKTDILFGFSMCKGDVNNDGLTDVIVGSPNSDYDVTTLTNNNNVGSVNVYYGVSAGEIDFAHPSQTLYAPGAQSGGTFGMACVVMDYNADGYQDLLIGSPNRTVISANRGAVYIYFGSSNTALPTSSSATLNSPTNTASALFGYTLAKGDFDDNGYDDLAVAAPGINSGAASSGRVYVYWADDTSHAITSTSMATLNPPSGAYNTGANTYLANTQTLNANLNFGRAMESFPTVTNSTGKDLVICTLVADTVATYHSGVSVATTDIGNCWIYEGKVNGGLTGSYQIMTMPKNEIRYPQGVSTPANTIYFGAGITKGDWNADGTTDLIICASRQTNMTTTATNAGGCFVYYGVSTGGFSQYTSYNPNAGGTRYVPQHDATFFNPNPESSTVSRFGESAILLDINNNGTLDFLVGEPYSDNPSGPTDVGADSGRVYIIRGGY